MTGRTPSELSLRLLAAAAMADCGPWQVPAVQYLASQIWSARSGGWPSLLGWLGRLRQTMGPHWLPREEWSPDLDEPDFVSAARLVAWVDDYAWRADVFFTAELDRLEAAEKDSRDCGCPITIPQTQSGRRLIGRASVTHTCRRVGLL